ncbi:hypothetical protein [Clostridium isatidis]|uniref:hypothetical protein n=1 Tax=Clostridium isatidis TaxID=182773 RepID=UPI003AAC6286
MRKYLNKSLLYQGDSKIIVFLCVVYLIAFFLNKSIVDDYFNYNIINKLYNLNNYSQGIEFIITGWAILLLTVYLMICYSIIVGLHKRKKWSLFLSGPFSKLDIRKREFTLMIISFLVFLFSYIISVLQNVYLNYEVLYYIGNFGTSFLLDIIRIICISILIIGCLALLDCFFSNLYFVFGSMIFILAYLFTLLINLEGYIVMYTYANRAFNIIIENIQYYLTGYYFYGNYTGNLDKIAVILRVCGISVVLIIIGFILVFISKRITKRMLVENMNEGIIMQFPKKAGRLMLITFPGIALAPFISSLINEFYFSYNLSAKMLLLIKLLVLIIFSFISNYFLKMKKSGV